MRQNFSTLYESRLVLAHRAGFHACIFSKRLSIIFTKLHLQNPICLEVIVMIKKFITETARAVLRDSKIIKDDNKRKHQEMVAKEIEFETRFSIKQKEIEQLRESIRKTMR